MNVVIAQSDVATAYGWGLDALWDGLLSGKTAITATDRFAGRNFVSDQAAMVPGLDIQPGGSRAMALMRRSLSPLLGTLDPQTPLILATTVGEIEYVERAVLTDQNDVAAEARPQHLLERVKALLGLTGRAMVLSSACASSATALTRAASLVRHGEATAVLVVACDAVSEFVYSGFSTLMSLCEGPAKPFDAERTGLTLGEAAAWALVTTDGSPHASNALMAILGWGSTTDAVHMTAPDRNAGGLARAIAKALTMAQRDADEVSFIAAHGTATLYSDAMEMVAFRRAMRDPRPVFSTKGGVGHTLGAAGLVQMLVTGRALQRGIVPPTVGLSVADPVAEEWVYSTAVDLEVARLALSTNSGFGGVNTAIIVGPGDTR